MVEAKRDKTEQRMVHVRLEPELHRRLRIVVAAEDTSMQEWLARTVDQAVTEAWPTIADREDQK
jgi:predicted HicB family RNase H-like nuclease